MKQVPNRPELERKLGASIVAGKPKAERPPTHWPVVAMAFVVLGLAVAVPAYFLIPRAQVYELKSFQTATVARTTIVQTVSGAGTVVSDLSLDQKSLIAARVAKLEVAENQFVKKGQVLVRLESSEWRDKLDAAKAKILTANLDRQREIIAGNARARAASAEVSKAFEQVANSEKNLLATQDLFRIGGESMNALEQAQANLGRDTRGLGEAKRKVGETLEQNKLGFLNAEAALTLAARELKQARAQLRDEMVRAPINGRIARLAIHENDDVEKATRMFTIVSVDALRIEGKVDQNNANRISSGQMVRVEFGEGSIEGEVASVGTEVVAAQNGGEVGVSVRLLKVPKMLKPGMGVGLEYEVGLRKNVLSLPRAPFLTSGGQQIVYVIREQSAKRQRVSFGSSNAEHVEITAGLSEGEKVIVSSYESFKDFPEIRISAQGELK